MDEDKLERWTSYPSQSIWVGMEWLKPHESMIALGALMALQHEGAVQHRAQCAWTKFWAVRRNMLTAVIFHMSDASLRIAEITTTRMARESWLAWHTRTWRLARQAVADSRGVTTEALIAARVVRGVQRCTHRSACAVLGRLLRSGRRLCQPCDPSRAGAVAHGAARDLGGPAGAGNRLG